MTSLRPYLIRAIYEWIVENSFTPYILVSAEHENSVLPQQFVQDGRIVLNLRPEAIQGLSLGNSEIEFNARFGGTPMHVVVPVAAVLAIYAKENGKGMIFDDEDDMPPPDDGGDSGDGEATLEKKPSKPFLKVVK